MRQECDSTVKECDRAILAWYVHFMPNTKTLVINMIEQLPEDASWEDIQERINFMAGVRKGLSELDEGKGISHAQVKEEFAKWLTD